MYIWIYTNTCCIYIHIYLTVFMCFYISFVTKAMQQHTRQEARAISRNLCNQHHTYKKQQQHHKCCMLNQLIMCMYVLQRPSLQLWLKLSPKHVYMIICCTGDLCSTLCEVLRSHLARLHLGVCDLCALHLIFWFFLELDREHLESMTRNKLKKHVQINV